MPLLEMCLLYVIIGNVSVCHSNVVMCISNMSVYVHVIIGNVSVCHY